MADLQALNRESLVKLTVTGRKTGKLQTVTIWFVVGNNKIYVTSGRGPDAHWIKNLRKTPTVAIEIGTTRLQGTAQWRNDEMVQTDIFPLFFQKYFLARLFKWIGWYKQPFAFEITPGDSSSA